jgi:hypothetical protein
MVIYYHAFIKAHNPSAVRSPRHAVVPGVKDSCTSSNNPHKIDKNIAMTNNGLSEYRRLRLKMDRAIRRPRIEYPAICKSLSPKKRWGRGERLLLFTSSSSLKQMR